MSIRGVVIWACRWELSGGTGERPSSLAYLGTFVLGLKNQVFSGLTLIYLIVAVLYIWVVTPSCRVFI